MNGTFLSAAEAQALGLINHVYSGAALDEAVARQAKKWTEGGLAAVSWTKTVMNLGLKQAMHSIMDAGMAYEALSMYEPFHEQAVNNMTE